LEWSEILERRLNPDCLFEVQDELAAIVLNELKKRCSGPKVKQVLVSQLAAI
jgi:hypothetical protein